MNLQKERPSAFLNLTETQSGAAGAASQMISDGHHLIQKLSRAEQLHNVRTWALFWLCHQLVVKSGTSQFIYLFSSIK